MLLTCIVFTCLLQNSWGSDFAQLKDGHRPTDFSDAQISYVASLSDGAHVEKLLDNILIPRVVGTPNHDKVHDYIVAELHGMGYSVEEDKFKEATPNMGTLTFRNIVGRLNPDAERYLVLACHYDSKYFKNDVFVGAIDSAVPCAMMLNLAKVMKNELDQTKNKKDVSLMLVFLDGEEAFQSWSSTDSIYGARHLADRWHRKVSKTRSGHNVNHLERVDAFVLLDLIGTPDPTFLSYFSKTEKLFVRLADAEDRLSKSGQLKKRSRGQQYFKRLSSPSFVEDDHLPFMNRGVPILHLIPKQFPKEWHTPDDNRDALDMNTVDDLNKILRVFVAEYLRLPIPADNEDNVIRTNRRSDDREL